MTASLYLVSILLLLGGSLGVFGKSKSKFNIDNYDYKGDPVGISCVYNENMNQFHQENITETTGISAVLIERLTNDLPLSLYVDGMFSHISSNGSTFRFAREWSIESNTNVCYLTYALEKIPESAFKHWFYLRKLVKSHRMQYAAKIARDLVLKTRDRCNEAGIDGCSKFMSAVTVVGYSLGAHIASQTCIYLYESTGEKVGKLIGIDPAGIVGTLKSFGQSIVNRGDAEYVQVIHVDTAFFGMSDQCADVDIYVKDMPTGLLEKHAYAPALHMAISMKKLIMIAERRGNGLVFPIPKTSILKFKVSVDEDEIVVGVYSELEESKRGQKFYVSLKNHFETIRDSIVQAVRFH